MKTTRRDFFKLFGGGVLGALIAPTAALAELTHGASGLTPRERDVVADVMGLRQDQWVGWTQARARPKRMAICIADERSGFGQVNLPVNPDPGGMVVPRNVRERVLFSLGYPSRVSDAEIASAKRTLDTWVWKGTAEKGEIWTAEMPDVSDEPFYSPTVAERRQIAHEVLGDIADGEITIFGQPVQEIEGHGSDLTDLVVAMNRGSRSIVDNLGLTSTIWPRLNRASWSIRSQSQRNGKPL